MNLKIAFALIVYYSMISLAFLMSNGALTDSGASTTIALNTTYDSGSSIIDNAFGLLEFVLFGVGLPSDTPSFISIAFLLIQSGITIFTIAFIIDFLVTLIP